MKIKKNNLSRCGPSLQQVYGPPVGKHSGNRKKSSFYRRCSNTILISSQSIFGKTQVKHIPSERFKTRFFSFSYPIVAYEEHYDFYPKADTIPVHVHV